MTATLGANETVSPLFAGITIGLISWKAHETIQHTLASYEAANIFGLFGARRIHFNEISPVDTGIAGRFGFAYSGSARNEGIFGAVDALASHTTTKYLLLLENDCPLATTRDGLIAMLGAVQSDMDELGVPVFMMRSRRDPGEPFWRRARYEKRFNVMWPLGTPPSQRKPKPNLFVRTYEDMRRSSLRGSAIYAEEDPTLRHPGVIQRTANGNWLTRSSYINWSNCGVLVRSDFLRDVVLDRVRNHPAPSTLNGFPNIEADLKYKNWWRSRGFLIGQCEPGPFTHKRLDR